MPIYVWDQSYQTEITKDRDYRLPGVRRDWVQQRVMQGSE